MVIILKNKHQNRYHIYQYIPMPNYSLYEQSQIVGPNLAKRKNDDISSKQALNS